MRLGKVDLSETARVAYTDESSPDEYQTAGQQSSVDYTTPDLIRQAGLWGRPLTLLTIGSSCVSIIAATAAIGPVNDAQSAT